MSNAGEQGNCKCGHSKDYHNPSKNCRAMELDKFQGRSVSTGPEGTIIVTSLYVSCLCETFEEVQR